MRPGGPAGPGRPRAVRDFEGLGLLGGPTRIRYGFGQLPGFTAIIQKKGIVYNQRMTCIYNWQRMTCVCMAKIQAEFMDHANDFLTDTCKCLRQVFTSSAHVQATNTATVPAAKAYLPKNRACP